MSVQKIHYQFDKSFTACAATYIDMGNLAL